MDPKDEFKFPDEVEDKSTDTEKETDVEIEIVDDTPEKDRGRQPLNREVEDPTDDEIESYSSNVQKRIKDLTHARHDERRAKEALIRERQELERIAQHLMSENKKLQSFINDGTNKYVSMAKEAAEAKLEKARRDYKAAQEAFDTEAILAAQEALLEAKMEVDAAKRAKKDKKLMLMDYLMTQIMKRRNLVVD